MLIKDNISYESSFKLSNNPGLGKQLKNVRENTISNKPNLEEIFALSQQGESQYNFFEANNPTEKKIENNDIGFNFDKILNKALNPYSNFAGK
jgi:hypothetical protein